MAIGCDDYQKYWFFKIISAMGYEVGKVLSWVSMLQHTYANTVEFAAGLWKTKCTMSLHELIDRPGKLSSAIYSKQKYFNRLIRGNIHKGFSYPRIFGPSIRVPFRIDHKVA